jgi:hypothetical protein
VLISLNISSQNDKRISSFTDDVLHLLRCSILLNMICEIHKEIMDPPRIELGTPRCKRGILPLDYGPLFLF